MGRVLKPCGTRAAYLRGCRCEPCRKADYNEKKQYATPEAKRRWRHRTKGAYRKANMTYKLRFVQMLADLRKAVPCEDCGDRLPYYCMDFDHLPQFDKLHKVSSMRNATQDWRLIVNEINKCDVVCANCHRKRTNQRIQDLRFERYGTEF